MKKKVFVEDLEPGMYVSELDRPWLDTPFLFQGFIIENEEQLADLRRYCHFVYVDPLQSSFVFKPERRKLGPSQAVTPGRRPQGKHDGGRSILSMGDSASTAGATARLLNKLRVNYPDQAKVEEELPIAEKAHEKASLTVHEIFRGIDAKGVLNAPQMQEAISEITESIVRNPDALLLLTRLKQKSEYIYDHALNVSIHLLAFGRYLGFPKEQMHILGAAGMLLDVGMGRLSQDILSKKGQLSPEEYEVMKGHVLAGVEIIRNTSGIAPKVADIVAEHHEREDGSGYPNSLQGKKISLLGKMAAIVDSFEALISERPYAAACTPFEALQLLYDWRGTYFHEELVEQFIQCMGIHPVGTLVELNSGEVAIVLAHNRVRRLKPRVMVILDPEKKPYGAPIMLDLLSEPKFKGDEPYQIRRALAEGMYGVNLHDYYV